jgi:uncharacterized protein YndB with AHSA1/START domain
MKIQKTYQLAFPPERVFTAWVSSNTVIAPATAMDINPVVGGHYRLIMETPEFTGRNEGKFLAVERGRHIRYTWEWNGDGEVSEIDVVFSENDGGTQIDLIHSKFEKQKSADQHNSGWDSYMEGFTAFLNGQ